MPPTKNPSVNKQPSRQSPVGTPVGGLPKPTLQNISRPDNSQQAQKSLQNYGGQLEMARSQSLAGVNNILDQLNILKTQIKPPSKKNYFLLAIWTIVTSLANDVIEDVGADATILLLFLRYVVLKGGNFVLWWFITRKDNKQALLLQQIGGVIAVQAEHLEQKTQNIKQKIRQTQLRTSGKIRIKATLSKTSDISGGAPPGSSKAGVPNKTQAIKQTLTAIRYPTQIDIYWILSLIPLLDNFPWGTKKVWDSYRVALHNYENLSQELYSLGNSMVIEYRQLEREYEQGLQEAQQELI